MATTSLVPSPLHAHARKGLVKVATCNVPGILDVSFTDTVPLEGSVKTSQLTDEILSIYN